MSDPFHNSNPFKKPTVPIVATVMVRYKDGKVVANHNITNPWPYMISLKKHPNVQSVWIEKK